MNGEAIISVSIAVVALTQIVKWASIITDKTAPFGVLLLSAIGVGIWVWSSGAWSQTNAFQIFTGWITVSMSSAGVFGFTRATTDTVTRLTTPK